MNACPRIRHLVFPGLVLGGLLGSGLAQEACLKGCAYPPYPGLFFTLGDGFVAKGGEEVKVTHMGFLGSVYNNDGITPRRVGLPNFIGELYAIDPVTGEERFLFKNQHDWTTHANDSGKVVSLGVYPKGAPVVFKYVNVDGKERNYKTFPRYSGDNAAGTYDFGADPLLRTLAINGRPKPVSGGTWNWEGKDHNKWCVAADVPGTGEKQFQFEDADDRIFNDIVFRVSGVALVSETRQLGAPAITGATEADGRHRVVMAVADGEADQGSTLFYTDDGTAPAFDSSGTPLGSTKVYAGPLLISATTTFKAKAWKATAVKPNGGVVRSASSPQAEATFTRARRKLAAPTANPPGRVFSGPLSVSLAQAEGAPIRYRLCDVGAACPDPDASAPLYAGPLSLAGPKVIKAIAIQAPHQNSDVAVFAYRPGKWAAPTATPAGGGFTGPVAVALAQADGARIFYRVCEVGAPCPDPDAAASAYAGPFTLASPKVVKAVAIEAPHENSDVAAWTFLPVYRLTEAAYLDRDGDGRIETARLAFEGNPATLPPAVVLEDPFSPGRKREVREAELRRDPAAPGILWAPFADRPCERGTGFAAGPFGLFAKGNPSYDSQAFPVKDAVGPVILSAEAVVSLDDPADNRLTVRFSEPLASPGSGDLLPFRVKRGGADITASLRIRQAEPLGNATWRYAFAGAAFPVPGDSLQASPRAEDGLGNSANMAYWVPVGGKVAALAAKVRVSGGGCARGRALADPQAWSIPLNVITPRDSARGRECVDARASAECLDCRTGEWRRLDPRRSDWEALPAGPEIRVTTKYPFAFDLRFFNNLGEFVNAARGKVSEEMLAGAPADAEGYRTVSLQWYPVSAAGTQAGTGAYIAKGGITVEPPERIQVQGVPVSLKPVREAVQVTFGYVRE